MAMKISYDLHLHSCLSPCADRDMTPNNIVNMAVILGLDAIAVCDHNSARNLPAVFRVAEQVGILAVPAMELCTAEEIHMLCLFPALENALACSAAVYPYLPAIPNRPEIFGEQLILDENDEVTDEEPYLLINALTLSLEELISMVQWYGGLPIPAHADKDAYSITASLGMIPPEYGFSCIEQKNPAAALDFAGRRIYNSDAHDLEHINEPVHFLEVAGKSAVDILAALRQRNQSNMKGKKR